MRASTLFEVRQALYALIAEVMPSEVVFGWDRPKTPAGTNGPHGARRAVWLAAPVDGEAARATMPDGWSETYVQPVIVQCLPVNGSVDVPTADEAAADLFDLIVEQVESNKRLAGYGPPDGWSTVVMVGGWEFRSGWVENDPGYAAGYEIQIRVEANRCS